MNKCTMYDYIVEDLSLSTIQDKLEAYSSRDLGELEMSHFGWDKFHDANMPFIVSEDIIYLKYTLSEKLIPASIVRCELEDAIELFQSTNGRAISRREKTELKDKIILSLAKDALTTKKSVNVIISQNTNQVFVASTSNIQCDNIVVLLLKSLGMQLTIPSFDLDPMVLMTRMVIEDKSLVGVDDLYVMDSGVLSNDKQKATFKNQAMQQGNVQRLISDDGYRVNQLALSTENVSFVLCDDLTLKNIKYDIEFDSDCASIEADILIYRYAILSIYKILENALEVNK